MFFSHSRELTRRRQLPAPPQRQFLLRDTSSKPTGKKAKTWTNRTTKPCGKRATRNRRLAPNPKANRPKSRRYSNLSSPTTVATKEQRKIDEGASGRIWVSHALKIEKASPINPVESSDFSGFFIILAFFFALSFNLVWFQQLYSSAFKKIIGHFQNYTWIWFRAFNYFTCPVRIRLLFILNLFFFKCMQVL